MESATLSAAEAATALGISPWSIYEGCKQGEIPNVGRGRRVRIPRRWVDERLAGGGVAGDAAGITEVVEVEIVVEIVRSLSTALADVADRLEGARA